MVEKLGLEVGNALGVRQGDARLAGREIGGGGGQRWMRGEFGGEGFEGWDLQRCVEGTLNSADILRGKTDGPRQRSEGLTAQEIASFPFGPRRGQFGLHAGEVGGNRVAGVQSGPGDLHGLTGGGHQFVAQLTALLLEEGEGEFTVHPAVELEPFAARLEDEALAVQFLDPGRLFATVSEGDRDTDTRQVIGIAAGIPAEGEVLRAGDEIRIRADPGLLHAALRGPDQGTSLDEIGMVLFGEGQGMVQGQCIEWSAAEGEGEGQETAERGSQTSS